MRNIVFGSTGFIGGHVVEQLRASGHEVTAVVRKNSDINFLLNLDIEIVEIDYANTGEIEEVIRGHEVVYNCTADSKPPESFENAPVEVELTKNLLLAASKMGARRFIQLSTIVIYDFHTNEPVDEKYPNQPEYLVQKLAKAREEIVLQLGKTVGIETIILRPASTIGPRDKKSFFARLLGMHVKDKYPIIGNGSTSVRVSLVDTRDIGRAMEFIGRVELQASDNGIFLVKGFDTTWDELKTITDQAVGKKANTINIPANLTEEQLSSYRLNSYAIKTFTVNRLWNDNKIRSLGFETRYSLKEAVEASVHDLMGRNQQHTS